MKRIPPVLALTALLAGPALADDTQARIQASRQAIQQFAQLLQGELKAAMQAGGPANAIAVCRNKAPEIAAGVSAEKGWKVGRTSLKTRNPGNAPDAWELAVLRRFEARKAAGEDPAAIDYAEVVEVDGRKSFRYMKAIPTKGVCLRCHGADLEPTVAEKLDALYPEDRARGFAEGDIRGAFTVIQPM